MPAPRPDEPPPNAAPRPARVLSGRARAALRRAVLGWFDAEGRALAFRFRGPPDPWAVLVSEVMAQQTQVGRVEAGWRAFLGRFPDAPSLAAAETGDVIRAWRGLGYNRRALDLQRAARAVMAAGGRLPADHDALRALPGVGPYTARAVAAIAFNRPVGAVDVNVRRVIGRIVAGDPARLRPREIQADADALVDPRRPGDWTHALMDLGATVCRRSRPACEACPARPWCRHAAGDPVAPAGDRPAAAARGGPLGDRPTTPAPGVRATRPRARPPFTSTTRWLRGRLVDRLRDAPPGEFVDLAGPLGSHPAERVAAALRDLAEEGLVELAASGAARLPGGRG